MGNSAQTFDTKTGARIRQRRLTLGLRQGELAEKVGISPSYLNLIEHNRRRIGGKMLVSLASVLGVDPQSLSQGAQADLVTSVQNAVQDKSHQNILGEEAARTDDLVEAFPGWAQVIGAQGARITQLEALIDGLNDRLTHDPVLSETMHDVLSTVSAIRSTSSILVGTPDLDAEWRARFHTNIDAESRRLAESSAAMVEHFEHLTQSSSAYLTPLESTQALFDSHDHHFPEIEQDGEAGIDQVLRDANLVEGPSQDLARSALIEYAQRARAMPLAKMTNAALALEDQDPAALARDMGVPLSDVLRRLAELPHIPGAPDIGCIRCDMAGAVLTRKHVEGFPIARFGAACALWPVFAAFNTPTQPIRHVVQTSQGALFTIYALAVPVHSPGFSAPVGYQSTMIMVSGATQTPVLQVGSACRVCPYSECAVRREPSIIDTFVPVAQSLEGF